MKQYARDFFRVPPGRGHRMPALRVAVGIVIPLLALVLTGRTDLTIYALLGALTGVYGRIEPHCLRLKHQSFAGIIMCASVIGGVAAATAGLTQWSLIALSTVIAGALSLVADRLHLRPAGPFFFLFAFTASASIPFREPLWQAAAAAAISVAVVLLIGFSGRLRAPRSGPQPSLHEPAHPPWPRMLGSSVQPGRYAPLAIQNFCEDWGGWSGTGWQSRSWPFRPVVVTHKTIGP